MTIMFWINPTSNTLYSGNRFAPILDVDWSWQAFKGIFDHNDLPDLETGGYAALVWDTKVVFAIGACVGTEREQVSWRVRTKNRLPTNRWTHVTITRQKAEVKIYFDGAIKDVESNKDSGGDWYEDGPSGSGVCPGPVDHDNRGIDEHLIMVGRYEHFDQFPDRSLENALLADVRLYDEVIGVSDYFTCLREEFCGYTGNWTPYLELSIDTFESGTKTCNTAGCSVSHTFSDIPSDLVWARVTVEQSGDLDDNGETTSLKIGSTTIATCYTGTTYWAIATNCKDVDVARFVTSSGTLVVSVDGDDRRRKRRTHGDDYNYDYNYDDGAVPLGVKIRLTYAKQANSNITNATCGDLEQEEVKTEKCAAAGISCCINPRTPEVRAQNPCPAKEGDYAHFALSEVPSSCESGWLNGLWQYVGKTADDRPYYKLWNAAVSAWKYMFYDKDCNGNADGGAEEWIIDSIEPNTTALQALDGAGVCSVYGHTAQPTTSTTPQSGMWRMSCGGGFDTHNLTLTPDCTTTPDYTYEWNQWTPQQTDNTTCGELDQRDTVEACASDLGCCLNQQVIRSEVRVQALCPPQEGDYANFAVAECQSCA
jgi:hypothetical protein